MTAYLASISIWILIYALMTLALALQYGFTGLTNFGLVGFVAIGAYASALLSIAGVPVIASIPLACLIAAVAAYPLGLATLRLSGEYFAIITLGFAESVRVLLVTQDWLTKGVMGLTGVPRLFPMSLGYRLGDYLLLILLILLNIAGALLIRRIVRSPFGRTIEAIRDDEVAVRALGKNPAGYKIKVLMLGAAIAALSGAMQAHFLNFLAPEQFASIITFYIWIAMLIGGEGRLKGMLVGTIIIVTLLEGSRFLPDFVPGVTVVQASSVRFGVVGIVLILLMLYRPDGLFSGNMKRQ